MGNFCIKSFIRNNRVLILSLKRGWFDVMVTGEKPFECRTQSDFMNARLLDKYGLPKDYDYCIFINGYGWHLPVFICEYKGFELGIEETFHFSNGMILNVQKDNYIIRLGKIIHKFNLRQTPSTIYLL